MARVTGQLGVGQLSSLAEDNALLSLPEQRDPRDPTRPAAVTPTSAAVLARILTYLDCITDAHQNLPAVLNLALQVCVCVHACVPFAFVRLRLSIADVVLCCSRAAFQSRFIPHLADPSRCCDCVFRRTRHSQDCSRAPRHQRLHRNIKGGFSWLCWLRDLLAVLAVWFVGVVDLCAMVLNPTFPVLLPPSPSVLSAHHVCLTAARRVCNSRGPHSAAWRCPKGVCCTLLLLRNPWLSIGHHNCRRLFRQHKVLHMLRRCRRKEDKQHHHHHHHQQERPGWW